MPAAQRRPPSGFRSQQRQQQGRGSEFRSPITQRAINAAGGVSALADALGISPAAVSEWPRIPVERVVDIERITGIHRAELRPDLKYLWQ